MSEFRCIFSNSNFFCALCRNETMPNTCECVGDTRARKCCPLWQMVESLRLLVGVKEVE